MPPLRLVRLPAQPRHQPVREPHVGRVANDSIDPLDLGDRIERGQGRAKRPVARPDRRHDVLAAPENSASAAAGCNTTGSDRPRRAHDTAAPAATAPSATPASATAANERPAARRRPFQSRHSAAREVRSRTQFANRQIGFDRTSAHRNERPRIRTIACYSSARFLAKQSSLDH